MTQPLNEFEDFLKDTYPLLDLKLELWGSVLEIVSIAFPKTEQRKGYGRAVIEEIKKYAKELGVTNIVLHSAPSACGFYNKLGFIRISTNDNYICKV